MNIYKTYKFRIYPNKEQTELINKTIGCARFVYNYFLDKKIKLYEKDKIKLSVFECCNMVRSELNIKYPWLKEVDSISIRSTIFNLNNAFKMFFKGSGFPKFKSKYSNINSYKTKFVNNNIRIDLEKRVVRLPKLKDVKIRGYRNLNKLNGRIINATIVRELTGKYYINVLVEEKLEEKENKIEKVIGIDLGVKTLVTCSNGEKINNPKYINKYEKRIKRMQRRLSKKQRGSNNYYKIKQKLAVLYTKLKNARKYLIHQITNKLTKENDLIIAEKLKVKEMTKNKNLSKNIINACFYQIIRQIEYKMKWLCKKFYQIDTYYPSSQICSVCGSINKEMKDLSKRKYECKMCNNKIDRDINASINIKFEGLKKLKVISI